MDLSGFFQMAPLPSNRLYGHYNLGLVIVSYVIAFFTSYIALDFAGRLRLEHRQRMKWFWLMGGALSMGAGIWSMHFIGMLAFIMPMSMSYAPFWTISSLFAAIMSAGFALFLLRDEKSSVLRMFSGGIVLGLGIATMHYMGMAGMVGMSIHYLPGLFTLSIFIAVAASEAALWFIIKSNQGSFIKQIRLKIMSGLVMGAAICGMHYTGMAAAVFTLSPMHTMVKSIDPFSLTLYISCVTGIILISALLVSTYKQLIVNAVRNEKNFLNAVLNDLSDGVVACDPDGKIIVANPVFKHLINLREADHLNEKWTECFFMHHPDHEEPIPYSDHPINRALKGEQFTGLELDIQFKNNIDKRNVLVSGQPVLDINGKKLGAVLTICDITAQIKATQQLEAVNQELDAFTYSVAHDLKSPLRAIDGFSIILSEMFSDKLDDEGRRIINIICTNAKKMGTLIEDLLNFSHMSRHEIHKEKLNMNQLIEGVCNELMQDIPHREIEFNVKSLPDVIADRALMHQVWVNLISNAIKFTENKQHVRIEVGGEVDGTNAITYYVKDNGLGFDMKYADKLFGVFQRLHGQDIEGTGIGLANVKRIITRHGGVVRGEGTLGSGATFYVTLPKE